MQRYQHRDQEYERAFNGVDRDGTGVISTEELGQAIRRKVHGEAEINEIVNSGADVVVKLAFSWCRPCKAFYPRYEKFAEIYGETQFLRIVGNENESCKHYAKDVLQAKISPMFAAYSKGQLVATWNGANILRFVENMEQNLPSARKFSKEREAVQASDPSMAPK
ncbi:unnamed protein product [Polarella glacialis]|uniref:Thioredoxin domain-containing protein n=1 Tax=Polarella glacialis TaxID=89957 RepID=A0A813GFY2_POLGL|nr:unnamed protein product [Polarella glacialis]